MKAAQIQTLLSVQAQVITGLHEEYAKLKAERKRFNAESDKHASAALQHDDFGNFEAAEEAQQLANAFAEQAALFTPYIKRFKRKIAALSDIQKTLKGDLHGQQSLEAWIVEDDAFWLQQAYVARQEGYSVTYSFDEAAKLFGDE
jgi:hypothetical protein